MSISDKKFDLTIYLVKDEFQKIEDIVKPNAIYKEYPIRIGSEDIGTLLVSRSYSKHPRWATLFAGVVDTNLFGKNQSTGALLIVKEQNRLFLFSFGQGRHIARTECIETNFGLRAALNILDPNSIRSLDKSSLEAQPKQAREQSGEAVGLDFFGIDIESDLLRAITGQPKLEGFGNRVSGGDSIKLSIDVGLEGFRALLIQIYKAYDSNEYKEGPFSWIDHIGELKDKLFKEKLNNKLVEKLNQNEFDRIWLCAPKILNWDRVSWFKYSQSKQSIRYPDTRLNECLEEIGKSDIDLALLKRRKIFAVNDDDDLIFEDSVYRFIYAEIWLDNLAYILNAGTWYKVSADYVQRIQKNYQAIILKEYGRDLLEYDDENEGKYNARLAESDSSEFALMDNKNIRLPDTASPVESCDVFRREKELIHVKRYAGSSVLSHLFNQGLVSGELLQSEPLFRQELNKRLPDHLKISNIEKRPDRNEYTVVFAIISEQEKGLNLPFFSMISIKHAVNRLEAFGHNVKIKKVPVSERRKKTKKCPSR